MLMDLNGSGGLLKVNIDTEYYTYSILALKWAMTSSGKWVATDRGAASDIYKADIIIYGTESTINSLVQYIYNNRRSSNNIIQFSNFSDTEKIFGPDVDHSLVNGTVISITNRRQLSFHVWSIGLTIQAINPTFTGSGAASLSFVNADYAYSAYSRTTINKFDSYIGTFSFADHTADTGIMDITVYLTEAQAITFKRTVATERGSAITTTLMSGVDFPFGPLRDSAWPKNMKYLEVRDLELWGVNRYKFALKLVEDI